MAASIAPSALPAPMIVCSSSMKRTTLPAALTSSSAFFKRSSNSPLYFAPASMPVISSATKRLFFNKSGILPSTMRWAKPSAIAVLPTPGSPISTGLFLVLLHNICITRLISSSRPMIGSKRPSAATSVRSRPYLSSTGVFLLPLPALPTERPPDISFRF